MEFKEVLSPAEERFERWRKTAGFALGPLVFVVLLLYPTGLAPEPHRLTAVVGFVLIFWLTEAVPIPVTALLGAVLNILLGVAPAGTVLAPFAHPLVFLFIGSFIIAKAITCHGLDKRFAYAIFSIKFLQKSPMRVLFAFGSIVAIASMWVSNTASTAMMLPIALGVLGALHDLHEGERGFDFKRFSTAMMLMVAYGASVGGIATPIGTPPNIIGIGMIQQLIGTRISFFDWMVFAVPITSAMFLFLYFILGPIKSFGRVDLTGVDEHVKAARAGLGRWKKAEVYTAISFGTAVFLWLLPSMVGLVIGKEAELARLVSSRLNVGAVAVLAASILFILPLDFRKGEFTMGWSDAVKIDWGTILLFGGGLSIGSLMFTTGLADTLGTTLTGLTGATTLWATTAIGTALAIILSETTSNTASANMVIPVMIAIAQGLGVNPMPPALGATLGASFGFMLPVSTPPNAIVYGSGLVPILSMARKGIFFDIGGFVIIMIGLMILCPLFGWT